MMSEDKPEEMTLDERIEWQARRIRQLEYHMDNLIMWGGQNYVQDWEEETVGVFKDAEYAVKNKPEPVKI